MVDLVGQVRGETYEAKIHLHVDGKGGGDVDIKSKPIKDRWTTSSEDVVTFYVTGVSADIIRKVAELAQLTIGLNIVDEVERLLKQAII